MKIVLFLLIALASFAATASDTVRMDKGIVTTGMNIAEVISKAGQPSRIVTLENARA